MPETAPQASTDFFDVFISYRHRDAGRIDELEQKIRSHGYSAFRDLNFPAFQDTSDVTRQKIEDIRRILSRATCLIFAYSRGAGKDDEPVGVWMPWELGFFDGAISARIGVYLLDGRPRQFDPRKYFKGSEYLQLYDTLTDDNLKAFLDRNAVPERRIDNVASAFVWLEHLYEEWLTNPANVGLGVAEWYADHAARYWQERGVEPLAEAFGRLKVQLDDLRVTSVPLLRSHGEAWMPGGLAPGLSSMLAAWQKLAQMYPLPGSGAGANVAPARGTGDAATQAPPTPKPFQVP